MLHVTEEQGQPSPCRACGRGHHDVWYVQELQINSVLPEASLSSDVHNFRDGWVR
jgi:hypothetical protein